MLLRPLPTSSAEQSTLTCRRDYDSRPHRWPTICAHGSQPGVRFPLLVSHKNGVCWLVREVHSPSQSSSRGLKHPTSRVFRTLRAHRPAPLAVTYKAEHCGWYTQEIGRDMCFDAADPGGEVRGCPARYTLALYDNSLVLWFLVIEKENNHQLDFLGGVVER